MALKQAVDGFDIDVAHTSLEASVCPWAVHAALRERGPVVRYQRPQGEVAYLVTRFVDVVEGLKDTRFAKDAGLIAEVFADEQDARRSGFVLSGSGSRHLLNTDPPDHTRLRRLVARAFTPRRIEGLRPRIAQIVDGLLDELESSREPDLIDGFAFQLSITMICELMGVPSDRRAEFRRWSVLATTPPGDDPTPNRRAAAQLHEFLADHIAARREELADIGAEQAPDVLSAMIVAQEAGDRLSDSELVGMAFLLLIAGHETTVGLIGSMALGLARYPDQRRLLIEDPELIGNAVEEFLRYDGSVQRSTFRVAIEDIEIADTHIPKGSIVTMNIGGANNDPAVFDDPETLDITREIPRHVAFGQGPHFCLGAPLARLEAKVAIGRLVERFPDYQVLIGDDQLRYQPTVVRALTRLPVTLTS